MTVTVTAEVNRTAEPHVTAFQAIEFSEEERNIDRPFPFGAVSQESSSGQPTTFSTVVVKTGLGLNLTVASAETAVVDSPAVGKSSSVTDATKIAAGEVEMTKMTAAMNSPFAMPTMNAVVIVPLTLDSISIPTVPDARNVHIDITINGMTVYLSDKVPSITATVTESSTTTIFLSPSPTSDFTSTQTATSLTMSSAQSSSEGSAGDTVAEEDTTVTEVITRTTTTLEETTSSAVADQLPVRILGPQGSNATTSSRLITTGTGGVAVDLTTRKSTSTTTTSVVAPQPTTTLTRTVIWSNQTASAVEASLDVISTLASDGSIPTDAV